MAWARPVNVSNGGQVGQCCLMHVAGSCRYPWPSTLSGAERRPAKEEGHEDTRREIWERKKKEGYGCERRISHMLTSPVLH